jgi:GTP-sensing pleiotropic transcriptional regulator CodY
LFQEVRYEKESNSKVFKMQLPLGVKSAKPERVSSVQKKVRYNKMIDVEDVFKSCAVLINTEGKMDSYSKNQQTIASKTESYNEPRRGTRIIDTDKGMSAYLNANDFKEDYKEDLMQMYYDQGFVEVER